MSESQTIQKSASQFSVSKSYFPFSPLSQSLVVGILVIDIFPVVNYLFSAKHNEMWNVQ